MPGKKSITHSVSTRLHKWAQNHLRDLPWRTEPRNPYHVWISEVMLQQTQVVTVAPYFARFVAAFPNVHALAAAPLDAVLKLWEGLGYYGRARNLHRAAQLVVTEHAGELPRTAQELMQLPGIGRYTAGAIASIAFGEKAPVLDGNVKRVLCRLFAIKTDPRTPATEKHLWQLAESLLPANRAGAFNEALMELGATVCTPRAPDCPHCPLAKQCQAFTQNIAEQLPVKAPRKTLPHYDVTAAVIRKRGKLLIAQRPAEGMLGGLWEFPGGKCHAGETLAECLRREIQEELDIEINVGEKIVIVKHAYTHFRITLHAYECRHLKGRIRPVGVADWRWVTLDEIDAFAFPVTDQKIIAALQQKR
jgi:A/G-specific adenine glycosylase